MYNSGGYVGSIGRQKGRRQMSKDSIISVENIYEIAVIYL